MMANLAQICGEIAKPWKFVLCEPTLAVREKTLLATLSNAACLKPLSAENSRPRASQK
ncbi:hypothetical protein SAMN05443248_4303 [Bradyrhizobium erythrophlei]|jgi:hypothetical protein|uniref:Uncharacterized protein n=1 Tax=Bradyrhizobium erythrophlei TaxID=1437360 RepID=A0A1M5RQ03_9BRAD|nr:hypothetical protein SAMN05443248_4303 [Bradyrhizobium erythrophlei]